MPAKKKPEPQTDNATDIMKEMVASTSTSTNETNNAPQGENNEKETDVSQVTEKETKQEAASGKTKASSGEDKAHDSKNLLTVHMSDDYDDIASMLAGHPNADFKFGLFAENDPPTEVFPGGITWSPAGMDDLDPALRLYARAQSVTGVANAVLIDGDVLWKVPMQAWAEKQRKYIEGSYLDLKDTLRKEVVADPSALPDMQMDGEDVVLDA